MEENEHGKNNQVTLMGAFTSGFKYSHEAYGEKFYTSSLAVHRDSGKIDLIPVMISDRLIDVKEDYINKYVCITGQFRSFNKREDKNKLMLHVFVLCISILNDKKNVNDVFLEGYVCKQPVYRETPLGREITDVILAVNRAYGKSDYIPCICWGRNAYYVSRLNVGDRVRFAGRIQSREYGRGDNIKIAFELSVNLVENV